VVNVFSKRQLAESSAGPEPYPTWFTFWADSPGKTICDTADSGMRKDRPNLIAGNSPEWTMRYTVIVDTRITSATSPTVRKCI